LISDSGTTQWSIQQGAESKASHILDYYSSSPSLDMVVFTTGKDKKSTIYYNVL